MKILVTGTAGFIGFHAALRLLDRGDTVIGLDNINDYYDPRLKYGRLAVSGIEQSAIEYGRLAQSKKYENYRFIKLDLTDKDGIDKLFAREKFDRVCHLAAQAGVRYSLTNPQAYVSANIEGTLNILESCRFNPIEHLAYASSSSVYGLNKAMPFNASSPADHQISLYAASKKSCEAMAHVYSHLFGVKATGLRFFTVYGPWGRPDMALFIFVKSILEDKPIDVFNNGDMKRDFTYIDDIVEGVVRVIDTPAAIDPSFDPINPDCATSCAPHRIYNIGRGSPASLIDFIEAIENALGKKAIKNYMPMQAGDVPATFADTTALERDLDYKPSVLIQSGVDRFVKWYREFYEV
ncbi:MAG: NAD-dependent epimerase [Helicobacteraceae bacterium]|jgi:UDP-glucuronate 4-epimerase|nr:NAD-dependent epimerase [Helicobacteraceae bacterium]